jgi:dienelactone hydrolase
MHSTNRDRFARTTVAALMAGVAGLGVVTGCSSTPSTAHTALEGTVREQTVRFQGEDVMLAGVLFASSGSPRQVERRPAIVLLHGCGGMVDARGQLAPRHRDWAERFARWGFVALTLDSFSPRGIRSICEMKERPIHPWKERTADALAALDYLVSRSDVDANEVFILGWSHGGSTVTGVVRPEASRPGIAGPHYKAAVAFYPGCTRPLGQKDYQVTMPMLILHGEADDWTAAAPCVALAQVTKNRRFPVQTIVYPGAHHGFDQPGGQVRFLPNVYNPGSPGGRGAHVGTHEPSRLKAIDQTRQFIRQHMISVRAVRVEAAEEVGEGDPARPGPKQ